jgi:hypothetical protein
MLIEPSEAWRGTDGRPMSPEAFDEYVRGLDLSHWKPDFVVLHNTASPNSQQWRSSTPIPQRLRNLTSYYRGMGWHGGPHMFIDDTNIWLFTPLTSRGVHSPSWNNVAWGIEMVGDYAVEDFQTGWGLAVQKNAIAAITTLLKKLDKEPTETSLRFHFEDLKTTHACPGKHVHKSDVLAKCVTAYRGRPIVVLPPTPAQPAPDRFRVLMTEFGGRGDVNESAYGGMVNPRAFELSLPCKLPDDKRLVAVYYDDRSVVGRVNDVGPYNIHDDYWNRDGVPRVIGQKARGERAEDGIVPRSLAAIDGTPAVFDELGIKGPESTRSAIIEWAFVPHTINPTEEEHGDHKIPPPKPPAPKPAGPTPWWQAFLTAIFGRRS